MKWIIVLALVGIVAALASAGAFMLRHGRARNAEPAEAGAAPAAPAAPDRQMARALAVRVGISVALFLFVLLSWLMGWVRPSGLPTGG
ncbi:MAG: DUF2909 domain-containing protein [Rubrivivax sp.]|nr:DUF2909 domain-containing protein [Rubrivivax sp.]